jgi:hypothetical protein
MADEDKKFRHPAGVAIRKGLDAIRYKRSDEGKAEKKARKEHNKKFGPTDKKTKRKLRSDAKKSDAAKGATMRERDSYSYYEEMKKGGAAFPDLTGDGKVTQKDILKGRGVTGFEEGGSTTSDADSKKIKKILPKLFVPGESGISDADSKKLIKNLPIRGESGKNISNADLKKLMKPAGFEEGGAVRGMGRAYMGPPKKFKIR